MLYGCMYLYRNAVYTNIESYYQLYSCNKHGDKSRIRNELDSDYGKRKLSEVICDTDIPCQ